MPHEVQLQIFYDYLVCELSPDQLGERYGVSGKYVSYLYRRWKKNPPTDIEEYVRMQQEEKPTIEQLEQRIRDLENQLSHSNLKLEAYKKVIEIAEEELGVDIVKKDGSRQQDTSE